MTDGPIYQAGQFGFPACTGHRRRDDRVIRHLPARPTRAAPDGPCAVCGREATRWVCGDSRVCDLHGTQVARLESVGVTNPISALRALSNTEP